MLKMDQNILSIISIFMQRLRSPIHIDTLCLVEYEYDINVYKFKNRLFFIEVSLEKKRAHFHTTVTQIYKL